MLYFYALKLSGLKINVVKSEMVSVGNVENADGLVGIIGCSVSSLPLKYLSLPLGASSYKAKFIRDGVNRKISNWLVVK